MSISKEVIAKEFLKELGIETPSQEQIKVLDKVDQFQLARPIIERMKRENKTSGTIANRLRISPNTVRSIIFKDKNK